MQWRGNYDDLIERGQGERIVVDGGGGGIVETFESLVRFQGGIKKP